VASKKPAPVIDVSEEANAVIAKRGGGVWVWIGEDGLARTATTAPLEPVEFVEHRRDELRLFQDTRIPTPLVWRVVLDSHRPERIRAYWNSGIPGGLPGVGWRFWRELFRRARRAEPHQSHEER
jgi:hypothetical protein